MTPTTFDKFRHRLEAELAETREAMAQAGVSAGTVTLDQSSVGRLSRMDALQQQAMAQASRERLAIRVRRIEAALARVRAGSFGKCCQCGAPVEPERLALDAATVFCAACQEDREAPHTEDE
jgi:DnaK suppressor protein